MKKLIENRKTLYLVLVIACISIFTLTIAYAALSATLRINGSAEVVAADWDIYFDNIMFDYINSDDDYPQITSSTSISFNTTLDEPGDKYTFTVDIVNDGSIDAVIDSIEKVPELTSEQAKYINYTVEYHNGDSIATKHLLEAGSSVKIIVNVEYRTDISSSDLPTSPTELDLSIKLNYVQSDGSDENISIPNGGSKTYRIVSGDINTSGSEICLDEECFYLISKTILNDIDCLVLFPKYNLYVGNKVVDFGTGDNFVTEPLSYYDVKQDSRSFGVVFEDYSFVFPFIGTVPFAEEYYWENAEEFNFFDSRNIVYQYMMEYGIYLHEKGFNVVDAAIMPKEFFDYFGCDMNNNVCENAPWLLDSSYWLSSVDTGGQVYGYVKGQGIINFDYNVDMFFGVRPVIVLKL